MDQGQTIEIGNSLDLDQRKSTDSPFTKPMWPPRPYRDTINDADDTGSFLLKGGKNNKSAAHSSGLSGAHRSRTFNMNSPSSNGPESGSDSS